MIIIVDVEKLFRFFYIHCAGFSKMRYVFQHRLLNKNRFNNVFDLVTYSFGKTRRRHESLTTVKTSAFRSRMFTVMCQIHTVFFIEKYATQAIVSSVIHTHILHL